MNTFLSPVRNLQIITHLMMLSLVYPECSEPFFAQLFEFITFDLYNTDKMYDEMFGFDHEPFNEFADAIGYPSRYLIFNSGSMTVFLWITILTQFLVIPLILCCCKSTRCCHKYAQQKKDDYRWAGFTDFLNEASLSLSFCVGINMKKFRFENASETANTIWACTIGLTMLVWPLIMVCGMNSGYKAPLDYDHESSEPDGEPDSDSPPQQSANEEQKLEGGEEETHINLTTVPD